VAVLNHFAEKDIDLCLGNIKNGFAKGNLEQEALIGFYTNGMAKS